ncbi:hypothetical protein PUNSTDRAFT_104642 [Punctularia strigosozonata HHB-11173 SS5]|uniref:uncharacterized protein n=1 Tax=Punctularia strigosozonata (strain HHB-11173) TaxID=741275 RepID=UPI0004417E61|nr:uncharacterized protein PUNSTDRAFT_104642 [Punctularia strigosozonata HHB-11173 SS5]EIN07132.1 hypothetical protein PUNSTDRAFT_104642 [Punctularia strigosozonata HHB-11173 SS5]
MLSFLRARCLRRCTNPHKIDCRALSSASLDPTVRTYANELAKTQPCFPMLARQVNVLSRPDQFHARLLDMIRRARRRIFLSSLYIGENEHELVSTLHEALANNPTLRLSLTLDLHRSTRPGPTSTASLLLPLLQSFPARTEVRLFRSPKLKGLMAKVVPPRFNEGWGTWHAKVYGADDEVMISGANLNKSYFVNRQDRYVCFTGHPAFADYCEAFLDAASSFSYRLLPCSLRSSAKTSTERDASEAADEDATAEGYRVVWPYPDAHPHHIEAKAKSTLSALQAAHLSSEPLQDSAGEDDVLIFPVIQAGQFNIREEERALSLLFRYVNEYSCSQAPSRTGRETGLPVMHLTSGYFNLHEPYQSLLLNSEVPCTIIAAAPKANGFFGSSGVSGRIPEGYTILERRFMRAVREARRDEADGIKFKEWERDGWTYHAKGIWLSPPSSADWSTPAQGPIMTLIGSTNLSSRSANLDTELSFVLLTCSPSLRAQLQREVNGLQGSLAAGDRVPTTSESNQTWTRDWRGEDESLPGRKVRLGTRVLVSMMGRML